MLIFLHKLKTAVKILTRNPQQLVIALGQYGFFNLLPDALHLKMVYRAEMNRKLNLDHPITFSEKLQWLKLHDKQNRYTQLVDKYEARQLIRQQYGEELLIPLLGVYERASDIDWNHLPDQFVIKCTHGSGCNIVCRDRSKLDKVMAVKQVNAWMKKNWYYFGREWPYLHVPPKIIVEVYVSDHSDQNSLTDYKFYCFEGSPTYCQVIGGRHEEQGYSTYYIDFYNMHWEKMPFTGMNAPGKPYPSSPVAREQPVSFERMVDIAKMLAKDTHFVRIDFYEIEGQVKFGEFTLYPLSGFGEFSPVEWNERLGDMIKIHKQVLNRKRVS